MLWSALPSGPGSMQGGHSQPITSTALAVAVAVAGTVARVQLSNSTHAVNREHIHARE